MIKQDTINTYIKSNTKTKKKNKKEKKTYTMTTASTMNISITKRDGRKEHLDVNKIHFILEKEQNRKKILKMIFDLFKRYRKKSLFNSQDIR